MTIPTMPPSFPQYPANWDMMSAADKISWVKKLNYQTPQKIADNSAWLKEMMTKYSARDAMMKAGKLPVDIPKEAYRHIQKHGGELTKAFKDSVGTGAAGKAALAATKTVTSNLAAPILAGALGALAIRKTKKKFDKELDQYTNEGLKRHEELMASIRKQRERKQESSY